MQVWRYTFKPLSAFATPFKGDTLFGQICWALRHRFGEGELSQQLEGYTEGFPYCVVSDAFPAGYLPRPHLPLFSMVSTEHDADIVQRKQWKSRQWLPLTCFESPVANWLSQCKGSDELYSHPEYGNHWRREEGRMHNSINRATSTTGGDGFAPYAVSQYWHHPDAKLDVYAVVDESRLSANKLKQLLEDIGATGFGKDASIGLGRFVVLADEQVRLPVQNEATAWMALAPCSPQPASKQPEFDGNRSYWKLFTRYGRHGSLTAVSGLPFKNPVLLADTGSVFTPVEPNSYSFIGRGLGGEGKLSKALRETVHQGYAPVVGLNLSEVQANIDRQCSLEVVQ